MQESFDLEGIQQRLAEIREAVGSFEEHEKREVKEFLTKTKEQLSQRILQADDLSVEVLKMLGDSLAEINQLLGLLD